MKEEELKIYFTYYHYKDVEQEVPYVILDFGMMQCGNIWYESVIYTNVHTGQKFTRSKEDFKIKFLYETVKIRG